VIFDCTFDTIFLVLFKASNQHYNESTSRMQTLSFCLFQILPLNGTEERTVSLARCLENNPEGVDNTRNPSQKCEQDVQ
jgi:hypothetical protein